MLQVADFLEFMLSQYANLGLPAFVERVINRSGLLRNILDGEQRQEQLQVLFAFTSFIEKETERNPRLGLSRLLEILKSMDANRIGLRIADLGLRTALAYPPIPCRLAAWQPPIRSSRQSAIPESLPPIVNRQSSIVNPTPHRPQCQGPRIPPGLPARLREGAVGAQQAQRRAAVFVP
ncbi:MAG: hypothetical protein IPM82_21020 [Saprospiraceae bacterium]|nr:hypothetical protein [Saprospiraceae bacterium]